jgi:hypothetical protein
MLIWNNKSNYIVSKNKTNRKDNQNYNKFSIKNNMSSVIKMKISLSTTI